MNGNKFFFCESTAGKREKQNVKGGRALRAVHIPDGVLWTTCFIHDWFVAIFSTPEIITQFNFI